jgi:hypothetical protein
MPVGTANDGRGSRLALIVLGTVLLSVAWGVAQSRGAQEDSQPRRAMSEQEVLEDPMEAFVPSAETAGPLLGIGFISSAEDPASAQQYANAVWAGASWNRWPLYWSGVETAEGVFYWDRVDVAVKGDVDHGLQSNVILMGTPCFYRIDRCGLAPEGPVERPTGALALTAPEAARPERLYRPVFIDGSDVPGPGKTINPDNVWASFVYATVNRYRPGGTLASMYGWGPGVGVLAWEMWNEPDLAMFWDDSEVDYARLLKVGYLAAKHADPEARILFGGLAYFEEDNFLELVLQVFDADPLAAAHGYFHDIVAVHNYFYAWSSWWYVFRTEQTLASRGLNKEIWVNESGMPAWNDYPGPLWDPGSPYRGTMNEQADFVLQSAFYATYAGADGIFHFQLYDGCGNQPAGTDFPPHSGELCDSAGRLIDNPEFPCAGDAFGLFRNPSDAVCFRQHPQPETPRPIAGAFRLLAEEFQGVEPLWRLRPGGSDPADGPQEWIAFYRPGTGERIVGLWARFGTDQMAIVPAAGTSARLLLSDGTGEVLSPTNGTYLVSLPRATNQNAPWDRNLYPIGGRTAILIEKDDIPPPLYEARALSLTGSSLYVWWSGGGDGLGSGFAGFDVTVSRDGGPAEAWLTGTMATSASYPAELGHTYTFTVTARDRAGNASPPLTVTVLAEPPAGLVWIPIIAR